MVLSREDVRRVIAQLGGASALVAQFQYGARLSLLEDGYDILTVQELRGHASVETTMIYTHVLNSGRCPVRSPLGQLPQPPG